jgi:hypothetical protein
MENRQQKCPKSMGLQALRLIVASTAKEVTPGRDKDLRIGYYCILSTALGRRNIGPCINAGRATNNCASPSALLLCKLYTKEVVFEIVYIRVRNKVCNVALKWSVLPGWRSFAVTHQVHGITMLANRVRASQRTWGT